MEMGHKQWWWWCLPPIYNYDHAGQQGEVTFLGERRASHRGNRQRCPANKSLSALLPCTPDHGHLDDDDDDDDGDDDDHDDGEERNVHISRCWTGEMIEFPISLGIWPRFFLDSSVHCTHVFTRFFHDMTAFSNIFELEKIQRKQKKNRTGLLNVGHQRETTIGQLPITIALLRICWFPRITLGTKLSDQYVVPFCLFGLEICPQDMWQHICETSAVAIQLLAVRISKPFPLYLPQWTYLHFYQTHADHMDECLWHFLVDVQSYC